MLHAKDRICITEQHRGSASRSKQQYFAVVPGLLVFQDPFSFWSCPLCSYPCCFGHRVRLLTLSNCHALGWSRGCVLVRIITRIDGSVSSQLRLLSREEVSLSTRLRRPGGGMTATWTVFLRWPSCCRPFLIFWQKGGGNMNHFNVLTC